MKTVVPLAVVVALICLKTAVIGREWTDSTGRYKAEADFLGADDSNVRLMRRDGKTVVVPFSRLSQSDLAWVKSELERRSVSPRPVLSEAIEGDYTTAIVGSAGSGDVTHITVLPGSTLWVEVTESQTGMALQEVMLLKPGSLLFIAEGGIPANSLGDFAKADASTEVGTADLSLKYVGFGLNGTKSALGLARFQQPIQLKASSRPIEHPALETTRVYEVTDSGRIQPSRRHAVYVRFSRDQALRDAPSPAGATVGEVKGGVHVKLLHAAREVAGWHKVRTLADSPTQGWVRGLWASAAFVEVAGDDTDPLNKLEIPGLWAQLVGRWESQEGDRTCSFVPVKDRQMTTDDGVKITSTAGAAAHGGMIIRDAKGVMKPAFLTFVDESTVECEYVLGAKDRLTLRLDGDVLSVQGSSGTAERFRRASVDH